MLYIVQQIELQTKFKILNSKWGTPACNQSHAIATAIPKLHFILSWSWEYVLTLILDILELGRLTRSHGFPILKLMDLTISPFVNLWQNPNYKNKIPKINKRYCLRLTSTTTYQLQSLPRNYRKKMRNIWTDKSLKMCFVKALTNMLCAPYRNQ